MFAHSIGVKIAGWMPIKRFMSTKPPAAIPDMVICSVVATIELLQKVLDKEPIEESIDKLLCSSYREYISEAAPAANSPQ